MGALLAVLSHTDGWRQRLATGLDRIVLPISAAVLVTLYLLESSGRDLGAGLVFGDLALSGIFCWLIASAARGFAGPGGKLLDARPLRYVGRISYGVYVYHPFMPGLVLGLRARAGWEGHGPVGDFVLFTAATLLVASASWFLLEKPLNELGRR
jgi:peptidoglycan/LPS O-acetylase OafA/YrhL